ncbi:hypothetical protein A3J90_07985 [candidate division WOR-1 bacterium RIFOXYC2_FULL_37_10]|uniref:Uncharacterized protein n=1 Tax=candidate division WOR-1 bacterium RIFOXYB2_FULL_37_13 TaxID=1802579 RepID=A0A1F4SF87_UNCSA|nr:MAG: hypothetical protein A2310_05200 [candidate division WOR-1 bacterium RIFOXYB2_FULL_37_13]OGC37329.1 MAG: hypothetical protein A3J90_07985 [candidate division WOR-1 bacterium RIFOXYC2_FULL_37_10]
MGVELIGKYTDSACRYSKRLPALRRRFIDAKLAEVPDLNVIKSTTPYGIGFMVGFPLFRTAGLITDYKDSIESLRQVVPRQWFYAIEDTHISLNVTIRADIGGHHYLPEGDKTDYYQRYLEIFRSIRFRPFSLRVIGIFQNGIILWRPAENREAIFNIRKQIEKGLKEMRPPAKEHDGLAYFDNKNGAPVFPGIIHTTYMRPVDQAGLIHKYGSFVEQINLLNGMIERRALFAEPLRVSEIVFMEERWKDPSGISSPIQIPDHYEVNVLKRKSAS